ncbi:hypothetical protein [Endobacterium cereale]|uniref:hypothetical protein n=1 Tax=Endobacterium cereale TaxID=2663029 RepID=UPI002B4A0A7D|nr:hypothetical protein [Endobacterium cereale]MEB2844590.1 hypothetical protein [Endobacterium cereale]
MSASEKMEAGVRAPAFFVRLVFDGRELAIGADDGDYRWVAGNSDTKGSGNGFQPHLLQIRGSLPHVGLRCGCCMLRLGKQPFAHIILLARRTFYAIVALANRNLED